MTSFSSRSKYLAVVTITIVIVAGLAAFAYSQSAESQAPSATPTPTSAPTPANNPSSTPTSSPSPTPHATSSPTATSAPTSIITASPTHTPVPLTGSITISGADAVYPMVLNWSQTFHDSNPGVTFQVSAGGAGKGMTDALNGLSDLGIISRDITSTEVQNGAYYVAVTSNAVVGIINSNNPVHNDIVTKGLSRQTLYNIFVAGNVTTWGQAVGRAGVTDRINVYTRSDSSGAAATWAKFLGNKTQADIQGVGVNQDPGILQAIQSDRLGIGFNNLAYPYDAVTKQQVQGVIIIPIDSNDNEQIDANESFYSTRTTLVDAIQQGLYPKSATTNLYLVTKTSFTGVTKSFVQWVLTEGQKYVEPAGFVPLTQDVLNQQLQKLGA
jgi:phosphate transport system substrate-binding protein